MHLWQQKQIQNVTTLAGTFMFHIQAHKLCSEFKQSVKSLRKILHFLQKIFAA